MSEYQPGVITIAEGVGPGSSGGGQEVVRQTTRDHWTGDDREEHFRNGFFAFLRDYREVRFLFLFFFFFFLFLFLISFSFPFLFFSFEGKLVCVSRPTAAEHQQQRAGCASGYRGFECL